MNLIAGLNELNVALTPIGVVVPQIVSASWEPKWISSPGGVQLIKGKITVSSPREFTGRVEVSLPNNRIAALEVLTEQQYQARIQQLRENLDNCYILYPTPGRSQDVCVNYWGDTLDYELGYRISVDGCRLFWDTRGTALAYIIRDIGTGVALKSWDVNLPAGQSDFNFAFLIKADEAVWNSEWWRIRYNSGLYQLSPTVSLYEGANLLDSVVYENAIRFTIGEEYPISIEIPSQIKSGSEFWASHIVQLGYSANCQITVTLYLIAPVRVGPTTEGNPVCIAAEATYVDQKWFKPGTFLCRGAYPIASSGVYTLRGIGKGDRLDSGFGPTYQIPAEAKHWLGFSLPKGIYHVTSSCRIKWISSADGTIGYSGEAVRWENIDMGTVEII